MQLYVIFWSFQNAEDQLFATNQFCEFLKEDKIFIKSHELELIFLAHTPQDGSGTIICKAQNITVLYSNLRIWRDNFSISFNIKPALTSEEVLSINNSKES